MGTTRLECIEMGDDFTPTTAAEVLEDFAREIDNSPAVLWIGEGGVKERLYARVSELRSGVRL